MKKLLLVALSIPILSALAGLILGPFVLHPFRHKLTPDQIVEADRAFSELKASREDFVVTAYDRVLLKGWTVKPAHPNGNWVLLLHGRSHNRFVMLPYAKFLLAAGYGIVMMDARAHGESGGDKSTYGALEIFDVQCIVKSLQSSETELQLFALGESMGAAVALQSAALVPEIDGVVAEGAFSDLHEVTFDYAGLQQSVFLGKTLFRPTALAADWSAQRGIDVRFKDISPQKAVARRRFPILLICGASDRKIPCRHSQAIYHAAIGKRELWTVPRTGHEQAIVTHPEEFQRHVLAFFESVKGANQVPPGK